MPKHWGKQKGNEKVKIKNNPGGGERERVRKQKRSSKGSCPPGQSKSLLDLYNDVSEFDKI